MYRPRDIFFARWYLVPLGYEAAADHKKHAPLRQVLEGKFGRSVSNGWCVIVDIL